MYPNVSLGETIFTHIAAVGNNDFVHYGVAAQSLHVSIWQRNHAYIVIIFLDLHQK